MAYQYRTRALAGPPQWYQQLGSVQSRPPGRPVHRSQRSLGRLGSLGDDGSTLSNPTVVDPTIQWQDDVLTQLKAGVATHQKAELQKWLQIAATLSIPLAAAVWRMIFKKGVGDAGV